MNLKFFIIISLLAILLSSLVILGYLTYQILTKSPTIEKATIGATANVDVVQEKNAVYLKSKQYYIIGSSILNLVGVLLASFLMYKN